MKTKKTPERFSIRFDATIPEHQKVIEILSGKGRNIARYIAEAIIAYEARDVKSIETTVTEVVEKILNMNEHSEENNPTDDFDFNEISEALAGFKSHNHQ